MKVKELQLKDAQDLITHIGELKEKLYERKMSAVTGNLKETSDIRTLRREIAICSTLLREKQGSI